MSSDIYLAVQQAVQDFRGYLKGDNPPRESRQLYVATLEVRNHDKNDPDPVAEYNWRTMALVYGALLAYQGHWRDAGCVFSGKTVWDYPPTPGSSDSTPYEPEASPACRLLAAFTAMGEAVAGLRSNASSQTTCAAAYRALYYFGQIDNPRLDRWRAVCTAIQAATMRGPGSQRTASLALRYLGNDRQSELAVMVLYLNNQGSPYIRRRLGLGKRFATIQPSELYLFNDE